VPAEEKNANINCVFLVYRLEGSFAIKENKMEYLTNGAAVSSVLSGLSLFNLSVDDQEADSYYKHSESVKETYQVDANILESFKLLNGMPTITDEGIEKAHFYSQENEAKELIGGDSGQVERFVIDQMKRFYEQSNISKEDGQSLSEDEVSNLVVLLQSIENDEQSKSFDEVALELLENESNLIELKKLAQEINQLESLYQIDFGNLDINRIKEKINLQQQMQSQRSRERSKEDDISLEM